MHFCLYSFGSIVAVLLWKIIFQVFRVLFYTFFASDDEMTRTKHERNTKKLRKKALVYSLMQDEYFRSVSELDKKYIASKILDDVKGRMLEDIVLLETYKSAGRNEDVFKFKFDNGGEYDMVIYDKKQHTCRIFEIKHSTEIVERQTRYLKDAERCQIVEVKFGTITGKYVLCRGEDTTVDRIQYRNVERFLCELK